MAITIKVNPLSGKLNKTSDFGWRSFNGGDNHKGTDFAAPAGTPIYSVDTGTVIHAGPGSSGVNSGYGYYVIMQHSDYYTLYAHMRVNPTKYVSVGQEIPAGYQIGEVGTTGRSTGNHLHFEIREGSSGFWSATPVDPMDYLSASNVSSPNYYPADIPDASELGYSTYTNEQGGVVYPETVASISTQPMLAFVEVYLGKEKLTFLPPEHLISFEFTKTPIDQSNSFILTVFDDTWDEVEALFSIYYDDVKIKYGFVTGKQSGIYKCRITDYSTDFRPSGTILSLKGITTGAITNMTNLTINTNTLNPTEAAKKICEKAGWKVSDENFHPSNDIPAVETNRETFALNNDRPATYIINKLAPAAIRSSDGQGGYRFYLDETQDPPEAYFRPIDIDPDTKRTYVYMKGVDSPVLDLQLSVERVFGGSVAAQMVGTELNSTFVDPITKEVTTLSKNIDDTRLTVVGEYSHTDSNQYSATMDSAGRSSREMDAYLNYYLNFGSVIPYSGYLTVIGDPDILPANKGTDTIRLIIITDRGSLHHTSGLYLVTAVTDSIQDSVMRTTMSIAKREDIQDGIRIANYRKLYN